MDHNEAVVALGVGLLCYAGIAFLWVISSVIAGIRNVLRGEKFDD